MEVSWLNIRSTGSVPIAQVALISKVHFPLNVQDEPPPHGPSTFTTGTWYTSFPAVDGDVELVGELVVGAGVTVVVVVGVVGAFVVVVVVVVDVVCVDVRLVTQMPYGMLFEVYFKMKPTRSTPWCISCLLYI